MGKIAKYLNQHVGGSVFDTQRVLDAYSTDNSILKIRPKVVAVPASTHDIRKLVRFSNQLATKKVNLPITARGTGLDKTGAAIGNGMIISMENMNNIPEIDVRQKLVRAQAGVTVGELNAALALHGLTLPIHGRDQATIGGLMANNYRNIHQFIAQAEIVLASGDVIQTGHLSKRAFKKKIGSKDVESGLYRKLDNLLTDNANLVASISNTKDNAGYAKISKLKWPRGGFNLLPIFYGSQGSLGIITEVIINCEFLTGQPDYILSEFSEIEDTVKFINAARKYKSTEIYLADIEVLESAADAGKALSNIKKSLSAGYAVLVILGDPKKRHRAKKIKKITDTIKDINHMAISTKNTSVDFQELSSVIEVYLNSTSRGDRLPLIDDVYIPEEKLEKYLEALAKFAKKNKISSPVIGSALHDTYSVRPLTDLSAVTGRQAVITFIRDYSRLAQSIDGLIAGGSPEGRVKAMSTNAAMDEKFTKLYQDVKSIFDPQDILNPGVKLGASVRSTIRDLRTSYNSGIIKQ